MNVGKIVARTAAKTALCILLLLILTFAVTALVWPMALGDLGAKWNISFLATTFTARGYDYSGDINDLGLTVERAVQYGDDRMIVLYGTALTEEEAFGDFADFKDGQLQAGIRSDYRSYVYGNIARAHFRQGRPDEAVTAAREGVALTGYVRNCALSYLVGELTDRSDPTLAEREAVRLALDDYFSEFATAYGEDPSEQNREAYLNVCLDYYSYFKYMDDAAGMARMEEIYEQLTAES